jgi:hypothetical protein
MEGCQIKKARLSTYDQSKEFVCHLQTYHKGRETTRTSPRGDWSARRAPSQSKKFPWLHNIVLVLLYQSYRGTRWPCTMQRGHTDRIKSTPRCGAWASLTFMNMYLVVF